MTSTERHSSSRKPWDGTDRRRRPTPLLSRYTLFGRRRRNELAGTPRSNYHIDRPEGPYLAVILAVALLVIFDASATYIFIHQGGEEGNPLVAWFLNLGPAAFWILKLAPLPLMMLYFASKRFFRWARMLAYLLLVVYTALAGFHVYGLWAVFSA